jgi:ligand-binding SRPBCC domain-containing protein
MAEFSLELRASLHAPAAEVWAHAATMEGVNWELAPWLRMSVPRRVQGQTLADVETGKKAFVCVLLGHGFDEESWSWLQRRWRHERRIESTTEGCVVVDRLTVSPRWLPVVLVKPLVRALFAARHRRLRTKFGRGT